MKPNRLLLDPNPPSSGDQGGAAASAAVFEGDGEQQQQQQTAGDEQAAAGEAGGEQQTQQQKQLLSVDEIAEVLKKAGVGQQPQQQPQQPARQWTEADFNQAFKVFKPTKQHFAALKKAITAAEGGDDEALQVLDEMFQGTVKQAGTLAAYLVDELKNQFTPRIDELHRYMMEQNEQALKQEFYTKYEPLQKYAPIVEALGEKLKQSGYTGTKEEAFKLVADQAFAIIKTLPGGNGSGGGSNNQSTSSSRMSTLTSGGQGGVGDPQQRGGRKKGGPAGMEVFD